MVWFFLKKNFCDGWDNLLFLALFNLIILGLCALAFFAVSSLAGISVPLSLCCALVFICALCVPLFAVSGASKRLADFKSVTVKETFAAFLSVWKSAAAFGLLIAVLVFMAAVALPFYFGMGNMVGLLLGSVIFWVLVIAVLSLQWFMPLYSYFGGGIRKNIKKCFILFFDNTGFSIFMFVYACVIFALSAFLGFIAPGVSGVILAYNNALRLRMYKYDWLETQSGLSRKEARRRIPWDELLAEDKETLGPRDFKSFIFPWK